MKDAAGNDISNSLPGLQLNDKMNNYTPAQAESLMIVIYSDRESQKMILTIFIGNDNSIFEQRTFVWITV